ncbi:hypothetical protein BpHYR1_024898 [Brachionus plicatilis]|uniref:Uncharacterized protein n=1 Tax=Brachionus plicatilis TaxID=10195 RepID=A0A3M7Q9G3_BRAPC|nr:hypothetical protein BpHYR1_024898 [Brachionus plicatilis]
MILVIQTRIAEAIFWAAFSTLKNEKKHIYRQVHKIDRLTFLLQQIFYSLIQDNQYHQVYNKPLYDNKFQTVKNREFFYLIAITHNGSKVIVKIKKDVSLTLGPLEGISHKTNCSHQEIHLF